MTDDGTIFDDEAITVDLDALLDDIYHGQQRMTQAEIHRRAVSEELPADLLTRFLAKLAEEPATVSLFPEHGGGFIRASVR